MYILLYHLNYLKKNKNKHLTQLMTEWCTIESDPGVFTQLIQNIGVKGIQVEEIFDMSILENTYQNVYGLIFLFKYFPNSGYKTNILTTWDKDLFFARQCIVNACATQAILSILLNNSDKIDIGSDLTSLKEFTREMNPIDKGLSISNSEIIRTEHNKFARPEPFIQSKGGFAMGGDDVFHFVAYIHFKNSIYELDGLKEGPILISENVTYDNWIKHVSNNIKARIALYTNNEIKFNLLAVVPNKITIAEQTLQMLYDKKNYIMSKLSGVYINDDMKYNDINVMDVNGLQFELFNIEQQIENNVQCIEHEKEKMIRYKEENERRQHNYIPLIFELLKIMNEKGKLKEAYDKAKMKIDQHNK